MFCFLKEVFFSDTHQKHDCQKVNLRDIRGNKSSNTFFFKEPSWLVQQPRDDWFSTTIHPSPVAFLFPFFIEIETTFSGFVVFFVLQKFLQCAQNITFTRSVRLYTYYFTKILDQEFNNLCWIGHVPEWIQNVGKEGKGAFSWCFWERIVQTLICFYIVDLGSSCLNVWRKPFLLRI